MDERVPPACIIKCLLDFCQLCTRAHNKTVPQAENMFFIKIAQRLYIVYCERERNSQNQTRFYRVSVQNLRVPGCDFVHFESGAIVKVGRGLEIVCRFCVQGFYIYECHGISTRASSQPEIEYEQEHIEHQHKYKKTLFI